MIKVNDKWLRILLPLVPCCIITYFYLSGGKNISVTNLIYVAMIVAICETVRYLVYKSRSWFGGKYTRTKRIATLFLAGCFSTSVIFIISKALRNYAAFGEFRMSSSYGSNVYVNNTQLTVGVVGTSIFYSVFVFLALFFIYETVYHFARLRFTEKQRDKLEKEKLQAELQQLKGIVNPHFLFNNLNSLSSLISEDPAQAEAFLNEFTQVFRYLLRNNNTELSTVAEELKFIHSYYHLLQTRYGSSISLTVVVSELVQEQLLPPLTLQLLVENAVKHNRLQKEAPLLIEIFSEGEHTLVVRNNVSKREKAVESTGIGLHSINSRYQLLGHPGLDITHTTEHFTVRIPLIEAPTASRVFPAKEAALTVL
ncbi:MAG TPA: histidine kinase [Flavisolibacter sp.]|nr:histidine kinase [Flavisolibacter sp.]